MERGNKAKAVKPGEVWFRKIGGGTLRHKGRIIKQNQKFKAYPEDLPSSFMDVIIPLDKVTDKPLDLKVESTEFKLNSRGGGGWFDVLNAKTGKRMNEKALKRPDALMLIKELAG